MGFTTLKDATEASRSRVMDQVYANYEAELNKPASLNYLNNEKSVDPFIHFHVATDIDQSYMDQIKDELGAAGWYRVSIDRVKGGAGSDIWQIKAYKNETAPQVTKPAPQPADPADEEDGIPGAGEVGAPVETAPTQEPASQEPTPDPAPATTPAADAPATDASASSEPAASNTPSEPTAEAPASDSGTDGSSAQPAAEPAPDAAGDAGSDSSAETTKTS